MSQPAFEEALTQSAAASGLSLAPATVAACAVHFELLLRWNKTHNLTRIVEPAEAARKHYLDCLVPLLALREERPTIASFVDVGSGAGFPGLLAALVWPHAMATLVEPAQKRASFLMLAARAMGLAVTVLSPEASSAMPAPLVAELVLSRATFSPGKRAELLLHATDAVAVWGHLHDGATWKEEVATWPEWRAAAQEYEVAGLEPRALLWGLRGGFHVKHAQAIP